MVTTLFGDPGGLWAYRPIFDGVWLSDDNHSQGQPVGVEVGGIRQVREDGAITDTGVLTPVGGQKIGLGSSCVGRTELGVFPGDVCGLIGCGILTSEDWAKDVLGVPLAVDLLQSDPHAELVASTGSLRTFEDDVSAKAVEDFFCEGRQ